MILKQAWLRAKMKCEMLAPPEKQLIMDLVAVVVLWLVAHRTLIIPQTLNPCVDLHIMLALSGPSQTSVEGNSLRLAAVVYARANKALASRLYGVPGHLTVPAMLRLNLIYTPPYCPCHCGPTTQSSQEMEEAALVVGQLKDDPGKSRTWINLWKNLLLSLECKSQVMANMWQPYWIMALMIWAGFQSWQLWLTAGLWSKYVLLREKTVSG